MEVLTLSSRLALPQQGYLDALFHLFAYLEKKHNAQIIYDPTYPILTLEFSMNVIGNSSMVT
jgi:CTP:phosphocholine cytidylyltransferase-like protein